MKIRKISSACFLLNLSIALEKGNFVAKKYWYFSHLHKNSLAAHCPHWDVSNVYPQRMFSCGNKKNIYLNIALVVSIAVLHREDRQTIDIFSQETQLKLPI